MDHESRRNMYFYYCPHCKVLGGIGMRDNPRTGPDHCNICSESYIQVTLPENVFIEIMSPALLDMLQTTVKGPMA